MPVHRADGYWDIGLDFLDSGNYIAVNRSLVRAYGLNVAVMVGELASEAKYWKRKGQLKDGWFFSTIDNVERATGLNSYYQREAIKRLQELGFVETEYKGLPRKRYFRLNCMAVIQAIAEIEDKQESAGQSQCSTQSTTSDAPSESLAEHPVHDNNHKEQPEETTTRINICSGAKKHPTIEEIKAYIQEKSYHFDPSDFFDYYSSSGWRKANGSPVKNWRQCCATWEGHWRESHGSIEKATGSGRNRDYDY